MKNFSIKAIAAFLALAIGGQVGLCSNLESGFKNPSNAVKPRTWMHAMSGNMSKVGMTKDLEALEAAGQGGVLLFNIANGVPYGDVPYNSDKHHEVIAHAAKECERLGLSFGVHNCDGWSSSGGPWITPEQSMKMIAWSETVVDGGEQVSVKLARPTKRAGLYKDVAVVAYPALASEVADAVNLPVVTASNDDFDSAIATDGVCEASTIVSAVGDEGPWILVDYGKPYTLRSAYLPFNTRGVEAFLEVSDDGENFSFVKDLRVTRTTKSEWVIDDQFEPVTARYFRIGLKYSAREMTRGAFNLLEMSLRSTRLFDNHIKYTGFSRVSTGISEPFKDPGSAMIVDKDSIIDLSSKMQEDGTLNTTLPEGKWMVMRFGMTSTGAVNSPASKWGKGLECDKFSREAYKIHWDQFCQRVIDESQADAPNALQYIEIDSYEMGGQNWTDGFASIFEKEKGYDIKKLLPVFAGRYVESPDAVLGIVYDLNDLYCELMTNNYFKYFTELCNENGLQSYVEPYGNGPVSTLDISGHIDLPMTEFWMGRPQYHVASTVSGAHIYGKNVISAESFTSRPKFNWKMHPALAKSSGDKAWTGGVNEFMFHRFVHQANTHVKPGLTMGFWGSHIDRTQTWWMTAGKSWFDYISRGSHLLRQGYPLADVLVFVGDGPHKGGVQRHRTRPKIPAGLNFDSINSDALLNRISIENNALVLPEGNAYRYLILTDIELVTLPSLHRIKEIVDAGVPVIGERPKKLAGYQISETQLNTFHELCDYIWSQPNCTQSYDFSKVQPDFVADGHELSFAHRRTEDADIYFFYNEVESESVSYKCSFRISNKIPELWDANSGEIRKLANFVSDGETTTLAIELKPLESAFIVFRESAEKVHSIVSEDTSKRFFLTDKDTVEVVSSTSDAATVEWSNGESSRIPAIQFPDTVDLSTDWQVEFREADDFASIESFVQLTDWKDHAKDGIKHYSGTAIYRKNATITAKPDGLRHILDLGQVDIVAEVIVNGTNAGVLWLAPFEIDITDYLKVGENALEIQVTNQWSNRLIGDQRYPRHDDYKKTKYNPEPESRMPDWFLQNKPMPEGLRTTFCTGDFYNADDELMPSGLKGPVKIKYKRLIEIDN